MSTLEQQIRRHDMGGNVWFYRPELRWYSLNPIHFGHDEYSRKTIVLGWTITGRIVIAYKMCGSDDCYRETLSFLDDGLLP